MKKTWKNLVSEITDLAFENEQALSKRKKLLVNAVNRSLTIIAASFKAKVTVIENIQPNENNIIPCPEQGFIRYCAPALVNSNSEPINIKILPNNSIFTQERDIQSLWYEAAYEKLPDDIEETALIELDEQVFCLLPLLACFYIWLDEDEHKAVTYRNDYEMLKSQFLTGNGKATVSGGYSL